MCRKNDAKIDKKAHVKNMKKSSLHHTHARACVWCNELFCVDKNIGVCFENKMVIIKVKQKYRRVMRFIGRGFLRTRNTRIGDRNGTNDLEGNTFYSDRSQVPQAHE